MEIGSNLENLCRERLRDALISGRRAECVVTRFVGLLLSAVILAGLAGWLIEDFAFSRTPEPVDRSFLARVRILQDIPETSPSEPDDSLDEPDEQTLEVTLKRGECLFDALTGKGISASAVQELAKAIQPVHHLNRLREGCQLTLWYDHRDGQVLRLESIVDKDHILVVEREGDVLEARKEALNYEIQERAASGTIHGSLFTAMDEVGLPASVTVALARIFASDVDFHTDLRDGDSFQVLVEEKHLDGEFMRYGTVLAARLLLQGRPLWAFALAGKGGQTCYYDRDGNPLRKAFLKCPLEYTRITSTFSTGRWHPILNIYRPHLGVDFAAPKGTPVHAVSNGRVAYAGWEGGFGNYLKIQHDGTLVSTYGHLSGFASDIRSGTTVQQGQVIGYVGMTGLATGPHLDFRLLKNGQFINPLEINTVNADPVSPEEIHSFKALVAQRSTKLEQEGDPPMAKAEGSRSP